MLGIGGTHASEKRDSDRPPLAISRNQHHGDREKVRTLCLNPGAVPITDAKQVSFVVEKFRAKYGAGDVRKYYSKFDVAVLAQTRETRGNEEPNMKSLRCAKTRTPGLSKLK